MSGEAHDSFYVGTVVFDTFLVWNKVWWIRRRQRDPAGFLVGLDEVGLDEARERILTGTFPAATIRQFEGMLDYFGEWPFIVRSSSRLEDRYGSGFAGQYDSVFCVNQGPREARLAALVDAIRQVYASTLGEQALRYRARRGLLDDTEQMALLIMRVSGTAGRRTFHPHGAGVGLSLNPYRWHRDIDPHAGVLRLVAGPGGGARHPRRRPRRRRLHAPGRAQRARPAPRDPFRRHRAGQPAAHGCARSAAEPDRVGPLQRAGGRTTGFRRSSPAAKRRIAPLS